MKFDDLERKIDEDYVIIFGGILAAILGGLARRIGVINDQVIQLLTFILLFTAPISIYSGKKLWGGQVARNMQFVSVGFIGVIISQIPTILFGKDLITMFGLKTAFWGGFFNFLGAIGYALISYGFYRFWKSAKKAET